MQIIRYNLKTGKNRKIAVLPTGTQLISMEGSKLYYTQVEAIDDNDFIIVGAPVRQKVRYGFVNVAEKKVKRLGTTETEASAVGIIAADNRVYAVITQFPSGKFAQLKKGKPAYINSSKYNLCSVRTGFYRNSILIQNTDGNYNFLNFVKIKKIK